MSRIFGTFVLLSAACLPALAQAPSAPASPPAGATSTIDQEKRGNAARALRLQPLDYDFDYDSVFSRPYDSREDPQRQPARAALGVRIGVILKLGGADKQLGVRPATAAGEAVFAPAECAQLEVASRRGRCALGDRERSRAPLLVHHTARRPHYHHHIYSDGHHH